MICGDKILTSSLLLNGAPVPVWIYAIEKKTLVWRIHWCWDTENSTSLLYIERAHVDCYNRSLTGRVSKRDRGITWCPTWIEDEAAAFKAVCALALDTRQIRG